MPNLGLTQEDYHASFLRGIKYFYGLSQRWPLVLDPFSEEEFMFEGLWDALQDFESGNCTALIDATIYFNEVYRGFRADDYSSIHGNGVSCNASATDHP